MTGILYLDWPIMSVSLFNAILSLWLALTVWLNAERRNIGVFMTGSGLLASAAFFVSHTAIVGWLFNPQGEGLEFWWRIGWLPITMAPFGWYVLMLWYSGFWESASPADQRSSLRQRHKVWLIIAVALLIVLLGLAIFIPTFAEAIYLQFAGVPMLYGVPILLLLYPGFIILCNGLALDAIIRPGPTHRLLGNLARQRSRPWLLGASGVMLFVSLLVTGGILWSIESIVQRSPFSLTSDFIVGVAWFDLAAATLIGIAIVMLGQAIVAYEVFTGKTLPRRGFFRNWRGAVSLSAGYAAIAGGSIVGHLPAVYGLLLSAVLVITFYALFNWRSFAERDQFMRSLRPFVSGQTLLDPFTASPDAQPRGADMFRALAEEVLAAEAARLYPLGAMSELVGGPLIYPDAKPDSVDPIDLSPVLPRRDQGIASLPETDLPYRWGIQIWTERGLIGVLLLSRKQGGGVYTQEEIEVARSTGEGIINLLASEEITRRLMALQRRRLTESSVLDRQVRRALHDDILPDLHTALLEVSALPRDHLHVERAMSMLSDAHRRIADLIHSAPAAPDILVNGALLPDMLNQLISTEFREAFDKVDINSDGTVAPLDPLSNEVAYYAIRESIRNAAQYARDKNRPLHLVIDLQYAEKLVVLITDDGIGLEASKKSSDGPHPGSNGGLTLHSTLLAVIGGTLSKESSNGTGTRITITVPLSTAQ